MQPTTAFAPPVLIGMSEGATTGKENRKKREIQHIIIIMVKARFPQARFPQLRRGETVVLKNQLELKSLHRVDRESSGLGWLIIPNILPQ